jgi:hypothetical protein
MYLSWVLTHACCVVKQMAAGMVVIIFPETGHMTELVLWR